MAAGKTGRKNWKREIGDPYGEGHEAGMLGKTEIGNPYEPGTSAHGEWLSGFRDAVADRGVA